MKKKCGVASLVLTLTLSACGGGSGADPSTGSGGTNSGTGGATLINNPPSSGQEGGSGQTGTGGTGGSLPSASSSTTSSLGHTTTTTVTTTTTTIVFSLNQGWTVVDITDSNPFPNSINAQPAGITESGKILVNVGWAGPPQPEQAYFYDHGVVTKIERPGRSLRIRDMNDNGDLVGESFDFNGGYPSSRDYAGFVYRNGQFTDIREYSFNPYAINNKGVIAGQANMGTNGLTGALYMNGQFTEIPFTSGGLNDLNQLVSFNRIYDNGKLTTIGPLDDRFLSLAAGYINEKGEVAGAMFGKAGQDDHIFYYDYKAGRLTDMGPGFGARVDDDGRIIGSNRNGNFIYQNGNYLYVNQIPEVVAAGMQILDMSINRRGEATGTALVNGQTRMYYLAPKNLK